MKYLKLFENHNQFYIQISENEYNEYEDIDLLQFSESEIDIIKRIIKDSGIDYHVGIYGLDNIKKDRYTIGITKSGDDRLILNKSSDEWYIAYNDKYVMTGIGNEFDEEEYYRDDKFYKCDQLEGLIEFVKKYISE